MSEGNQQGRNGEMNKDRVREGSECGKGASQEGSEDVTERVRE